MTTVYVDNSNSLELFRLKSTVDNSFINDATVTVTITDDAGAAVEGETWPLTLEYVAESDGDYRVVLPEDLVLTADEPYVALIDADAGEGRIGHWEIHFIPKIRRQ